MTIYIPPAAKAEGRTARRRELELLAQSMEGPRYRPGERAFWWIVVLIVLTAAVLYTAWVLNGSGPATGVL